MYYKRLNYNINKCRFLINENEIIELKEIDILNYCLIKNDCSIVGKTKISLLVESKHTEYLIVTLSY